MTKETRTVWIAEDGTTLAHIQADGKAFVSCQITKDVKLIGELYMALQQVQMHLAGTDAKEAA